MIICTALAALLLSMLGPAPADAAPAPAIWVGSPVQGTWGVAGDASTTPAGGHHLLYRASPSNDWAVDLSGTGSGAAAPVKLYVAPSNAAYNGRVTTVITQIIDNSACRYGGGGDLVTVAIRFDGATVGQATFAHIDRVSTLRVGQAVSRWGTHLGNVSYLTGSATGGPGCWTGPHAHTELRASTNYACWNRGYRPGSGLSRSNFIGFVTGPALGRAPQPCP
jgi:hypothetical protein